jgi:hypothetical protein
VSRRLTAPPSFQVSAGSCIASRPPELSSPSTWSMNSTPSMSSVRQMTRHDRRSPSGVRNLNSSGIVYALTPASFAPPVERSARMQGAPGVGPHRRSSRANPS